MQLIVIFACCVIPITHTLKEYKFRTGSNITISFDHRLIDINSRYACEVFALAIQRPFFLNGQLDDRSLKASQRGRFDVRIKSTGSEIKISLCIKNVQIEDSDVYIVNLRESSGGTKNNNIYDAYIEVIFPLGKAYCNIQPSEDYDEWSEVHCHAERCSANGGASLLCFQDGVRAPHLRPVQMVGDQITAVFWVKTNSNLTCCSAESDTAVVRELCKDFIYRPLGANVSDAFTSSTGSTLITSRPTSSSAQPDTSMGELDGKSIPNSKIKTDPIYVLSVFLAVSMLVHFIFLWLKWKQRFDIDTARIPANNATFQNGERADPTMSDSESSSFIKNEHDGCVYQVQSSEMFSMPQSNIQSQPPPSSKRKALPLYDNLDNEEPAKPLTSENETPSFSKMEQVGCVSEGTSPKREMSSPGGSEIRNRTPGKGHPSPKTKLCLRSRSDR